MKLELWDAFLLHPDQRKALGRFLAERFPGSKLSPARLSFKQIPPWRLLVTGDDQLVGHVQNARGWFTHCGYKLAPDECGNRSNASARGAAGATPGRLTHTGSPARRVMHDCLRCADANDAPKGPPDADAPEPVQHRHEHRQHRKGEKVRDAERRRKYACLTDEE